MARIKQLMSRGKPKEGNREKISSSNSSRYAGDDHTVSDASTQSSQNMPNSFYRRYAKEEHHSTMEMFAKMSTAIAKTLPEEEFGSQENPNYRPNSRYSSKVIYPVECKRDIFVESVSPAKYGKSRRGSGKKSIYHVNLSREQSPYQEIRNAHQTPLFTSITACDENTPPKREELCENLDISVENHILSYKDNRPFDEKQEDEEESLTLTYSTDEEKENDANQNIRVANDFASGKKKLFIQTSNISPSCENRSRIVLSNQNRSENISIAMSNDDTVEANNHAVGNPPIASHGSNASGTNASAGSSILRIETRSISNDVEQDKFRPSNRRNRFHVRAHAYAKSRLHRLYPEHHEEVSPSSTVSSLTLPAELEYNTPREASHAIALPMIIEDDIVLGEI